MKTFYIRVWETYVVDAVNHKPTNRVDFQPITVEGELPYDIMNGCYQVVNNRLIRDESKLQKQIEENHLVKFGNQEMQMELLEGQTAMFEMLLNALVK